MRMLLIASLASISACSAAASPPVLVDAPLAVEAVQCDVRTTRTPHGVRFDARAFSAANPSSGEYEFVITKRDRNGASDIVQGGVYDLIAGEDQSLGSAEIGVERNGNYHARLVLRDSDGVACIAERST